MKRTQLLLLVAAAVSQAVFAAEPTPPKGTLPHGMPPGPPPQAFDVCKNQAIGSEAQFAAPDGRIIKGKCQLILVPDNLPAPPQFPKEGERR